MASTTTNIPRTPLFDKIRFAERFKKFTHRFMLAREISALRQASHHISNPEIFNARFAEIYAELDALLKS